MTKQSNETLLMNSLLFIDSDDRSYLRNLLVGHLRAVEIIRSGETDGLGQEISELEKMLEVKFENWRETLLFYYTDERCRKILSDRHFDMSKIAIPNYRIEILDVFYPPALRVLIYAEDDSDGAPILTMKGLIRRITIRQILRRI